MRDISKRKIHCDKAYLIAYKLTSQQRTLWYLRLLGPAQLQIEEAEIISQVKKSDFHNVLFGTLQKNGVYRVGGAINKVEKIMRHAGFTGRVIRAFCQEAFRLALLEFRPPDWYQFVGKNNRLILRMTTDDFPVWVSEPDVEDF